MSRVAGLGSVPRRWALAGLLTAVGTFGAVATAAAGRFLLSPAGAASREDALVLAAAFAATSPWSLRLPSGASWRPAVALATCGMFLLPPPLMPLMVLPGLVLVTARSRGAWWNYPLTLGHVTLGLDAGALVYRLAAPAGRPHLPAALPGMALALAAHFVVNRLISAAILARRAGLPLGEQLRVAARDVHWGYLGIYVVGPTAALLYVDEGPWGLSLAAALLAALFKTAAYYGHVRAWQQTALTDGLTGAGNRVAWERFAGSLRGRRASGTLAMIDLDGFKGINDEYGHSTGDALLRELAEALREPARGDRLFRYGGDEFILFAAHGAGGSAEVRRRVGETLDELNRRWLSRGYRVRASFGSASMPDDAGAVEELLRLADSRMYEAKAAHRAPASGA
jgi:diguanylate cyclase (GGDEF)-like protein